ncbi:MAG: hypothetical protein R3210_09415 [Roseovarius sp.]|nr:hypothetical protein [Roseovarius sp.]
MSIWTSSGATLRGRSLRGLRMALMLAAVLPLAACLEGASPDAMGFRAAQIDKDAPLSRVAFFRGEVVVAGPKGYCIDSTSVRRRAASSFALLASCRHLASGSSQAPSPAVITVSVLSADPGATQPSAAEISQSLAPARILAEIDGDGISLVHVGQGGDAGIPGGDARYWRASLVINGHLVGLAAYGRAGSAAAGRDGKHLLIDMAEQMRDASPRPSRQPDTPPAVTQSPKPVTTGQADVTGTVRVNHATATPQPANPDGIQAILSGLFRKRS